MRNDPKPGDLVYIPHETIALVPEAVRDGDSPTGLRTLNRPYTIRAMTYGTLNGTAGRKWSITLDNGQIVLLSRSTFVRPKSQRRP